MWVSDGAFKLKYGSKNQKWISTCIFIFYQNSTAHKIGLTVWATEDGSTEALLQILYGQYLILGVVCFRPKNQRFL